MLLSNTVLTNAINNSFVRLNICDTKKGWLCACVYLGVYHTIRFDTIYLVLTYDHTKMSNFLKVSSID